MTQHYTFARPELYGGSQETIHFKDIDSHLGERLERIRCRVRPFGVAMSGFVTEGEANHERDTETPYFGASLGKLFIVPVILEHFRAEDELHIPLRFVKDDGAGRFDQIRHIGASQMATVDELLEDMLKRSGNAAYRIFADAFGPEALNDFYQRNGWRHTHVECIEDPEYTGRFLANLGPTSAKESLAQLCELLCLDDDSKLSRTVVDALENNQVNTHGIRRVMPAFTSGSTVQVYNKSGEYNGDKDTEGVRNDVGIVYGEQASLSYSLSARFNSRRSSLGSGWIADQAIGQATAEILQMATGRKPILLGNRAIRLF
jgi:hypothetical protein